MLKVNIRDISVRKNGYIHTLLENVYFNVEPGSIYNISGKNGAGKTTLLKSLTLLLDNRFFEIKGEVYFNGTELLRLPEDHLISLRKKDVKYVFQDAPSSFNPLKKINYYFDNFNLDKSKLGYYLERLQLPSRDRLNILHPYELSGGMLQRLSLVLALSAAPLLLVLDEPNSGIDYALSNIISDILKEFAAENSSSVLMATQDLSFAENTADYIGFIYKKTFSGFRCKDEVFSRDYQDEELSGLISAYKSL
jgi:peptide/nickel transport system ATP-binding protein